MVIELALPLKPALMRADADEMLVRNHREVVDAGVVSSTGTDDENRRHSLQ